MRTKQSTTTVATKPNGAKMKGVSANQILSQIMKITKDGTLKVANQSWDIFANPSNNIYYNNPIGA